MLHDKCMPLNTRITLWLILTGEEVRRSRKPLGKEQDPSPISCLLWDAALGVNRWSERPLYSAYTLFVVILIALCAYTYMVEFKYVTCDLPGKAVPCITICLHPSQLLLLHAKCCFFQEALPDCLAWKWCLPL